MMVQFKKNGCLLILWSKVSLCFLQQFGVYLSRRRKNNGTCTGAAGRRTLPEMAQQRIHRLCTCVCSALEGALPCCYSAPTPPHGSCSLLFFLLWFCKLKIIHNRGRKSFREFFIKSHRFYSDCDGLFSHVYASSCSFCTLFCSYSVSDFGLKKYVHVDRDNLYKEVQILLPCRFMSSQDVPLFSSLSKSLCFQHYNRSNTPKKVMGKI